MLLRNLNPSEGLCNDFKNLVYESANVPHIPFTESLLPSIIVVCVVLHNFLREHQSSDEIFSEYDMVVDENDEQSTQGNKVMCFVYYTMYGMMLVALSPNYRIAPVSWTLLVICCNEYSIDL
ncbi:hypothetical protein H5410_046623 [Solanum commersonii]|uniref:Uncharacterized protein n=1 Tax=Solanum commersonii TaxID=4109 RepID=A0A9J5XEU7_SOLCO|nr:hypothetical protein H5410_046623 [Solanum commersonii]